MTIKGLVDSIKEYQTTFNYSVDGTYHISGSPDYEIKDSFDSVVDITCHSNYVFGGANVITHYHYNIYFRFNNGLNTVQISMNSDYNKDFIFLMLLKLQLKKTFICTVIENWSNVNQNIIYALHEYAKQSIVFNVPDILNDIMYTGWSSIVLELNDSCHYLSPVNNAMLNFIEGYKIAGFAINFVYDYSTNPTASYDEGFILSMSKYIDGLIHLSTSKDHAECTMILLRWKHDMLSKPDSYDTLEL